tara:strand:- start:2838 stop:2939 length:102 start_codon:yes stop_codon:yes gene_type:complete
MGEIGAEPVDPKPNTFVADINATLREHVLDIAK